MKLFEKPTLLPGPPICNVERTSEPHPSLYDSDHLAYQMVCMPTARAVDRLASVILLTQVDP